MKKRVNRKAQAAIFLIATAVILLAGVLYFFYQKEFGSAQVEPVQPEAMPVKNFIEACLKNVAEDGIDRIGMSGGYIEIPADISRSPRSYLSGFSSGFKI